jgi:hypothetical protein
VFDKNISIQQVTIQKRGNIFEPLFLKRYDLHHTDKSREWLTVIKLLKIIRVILIFLHRDFHQIELRIIFEAIQIPQNHTLQIIQRGCFPFNFKPKTIYFRESKNALSRPASSPIRGPKVNFLSDILTRIPARSDNSSGEGDLSPSSI